MSYRPQGMRESRVSSHSTLIRKGIESIFYPGIRQDLTTKHKINNIAVGQAWTLACLSRGIAALLFRRVDTSNCFHFSWLFAPYNRRSCLSSVGGTVNQQYHKTLAQSALPEGSKAPFCHLSSLLPGTFPRDRISFGSLHLRLRPSLPTAPFRKEAFLACACLLPHYFSTLMLC